MPRACSISAAVSPPIPPPAMMTFIAGFRMPDDGCQISKITFRDQIYQITSFCSLTSDIYFWLNAGLADDVTPALRLSFDEGAGLGGRAATRADAQRGKALAQAGIVHRGVGGGIKFADDFRWGFRRRRDRMPSVGDAAVNSELLQSGNVR